MERVILHSDCNNFYASVECLYNPSLRGKPVAVGGNEESRHGIVLAKSYEAKKFGIQTGMTLWEARQRCKDIVVVPPHFDRYMRFSKLTQEIYRSYTDQVQPFGLDECWLDLTGSTHLFGNGEQVAHEIRERVKRELGITVSIGVSYNKIFAKLGSDMKKPDAVTILTPENFKINAWRLPASDLLYCGPATTKKLKKYGILTIGDLAKTDPQFLQSWLGIWGVRLWQYANGLDCSAVSSDSGGVPIKSIGNSTTTPRDLISEKDIKITLYLLAESVAARMREYGFRAKTVQLYIRYKDLSSLERQTKLDFSTCTSETLAAQAIKLYNAHSDGRPVRSLGVRACNLCRESEVQYSFYPEIILDEKKQRIETAVDRLRERFGSKIVQRSIMLEDRQLSRCDPKNEHTIHPIAYTND